MHPLSYLCRYDQHLVLEHSCLNPKILNGLLMSHWQMLPVVCRISSRFSKIDEILDILRANKAQEYTFSESKSGKDIAVAAAMIALGLTGLVPGLLPERWSVGWDQKHCLLFEEMPAEGQIHMNTYAAQLLSHSVEALTVFDVPFGVGGFQVKDVRDSCYNDRLSFTCSTGGSTAIFNGSTHAAVIPREAIP